MLVILGQRAIPQIGDLLVAGKAPGDVPALPGRSTQIGHHYVGDKAIPPIIVDLIIHRAAQ